METETGIFILFRNLPADQDREQAYTLAERLNKQLDDISSQLSTVVEQLNSSRKISSDSPLDTITQILNEHLSSLEWLEKQGSDFEQKLAALNHLGQDAWKKQTRVHGYSDS